MATKPSVKFDRTEGKFIYAPGYLESLAAEFAGVDVRVELSRMEVWLRQHPNRRGTAAFVSNWLVRSNQNPLRHREFDSPIDQQVKSYHTNYLGKLWKNKEQLLSMNTVCR